MKLLLLRISKLNSKTIFISKIFCLLYRRQKKPINFAEDESEEESSDGCEGGDSSEGGDNGENGDGNTETSQREKQDVSRIDNLWASFKQDVGMSKPSMVYAHVMYLVCKCTFGDSILFVLSTKCFYVQRNLGSIDSCAEVCVALIVIEYKNLKALN